MRLPLMWTKPRAVVVGSVRGENLCSVALVVRGVCALGVAARDPGQRPSLGLLHGLGESGSAAALLVPARRRGEIGSRRTDGGRKPDTYSRRLRAAACAGGELSSMRVALHARVLLDCWSNESRSGVACHSSSSHVWKRLPLVVIPLHLRKAERSAALLLRSSRVEIGSARRDASFDV